MAARHLRMCRNRAVEMAQKVKAPSPNFDDLSSIMGLTQWEELTPQLPSDIPT